MPRTSTTNHESSVSPSKRSVSVDSSRLAPPTATVFTFRSAPAVRTRVAIGA
ncbi:MAG: hypothetical protein IPK07_29735 [Deltaproteobacteria bacterium]|nr:hypothetical protein [Deltaproteobacteria bacterium]